MKKILICLVAVIAILTLSVVDWTPASRSGTSGDSLTGAVVEVTWGNVGRQSIHGSVVYDGPDRMEVVGATKNDVIFKKYITSLKVVQTPLR